MIARWKRMCVTAVAVGCLGGSVLPAQAQRTSAGRDAGAYKSLVGKTYDATKNPPGLRGWETIGGGAVNEDELNDPEIEELVVTGWKKGSTAVIVFQARAQKSTKATVLDVISFPSVAKTQFVALECSQRDSTSAYVGLAQKTNDSEATRVFRVWYVDRDRLKFVRTATAGITCVSDGP